MIKPINIEERRFNPDAKIELRKDDETGRPVITGYAAVFGKRSENFHWEDGYEFYEVIEPGAFSDVLNDDVRALINHDGLPLARTKSGTLKLEQDENGLRYSFAAPDTASANELVSAIQRGDVDASSFAFRVAEGGDRIVTEGKLTTRYISRVAELRDVSPVTYPAYPDTSVVARSAEKIIERLEAEAKGDEPKFNPLEHRALELALLELEQEI